MARLISWLFSRVAVIYIIVFIFCLTCLDLKTLKARTELRHLNDSIPDFSDMIIFSKEHNAKNDLDWKPYKEYFQLILGYMPDDLITKQLLGYVDFYTGQEQEAIGLFKDTAVKNGKFLFWSNYDLGVIYYGKGMWPQAEKYFFNAVASSPELTALLMQHSIIYKQIFRSPFFKYSLSDGIRDAQSHAYILLLSSLYNMKQYSKIFIIADVGLSNPTLLYKDALYYYKALAFFEMGQTRESLVFFQKSLTIEKNDPYVYYYLSNVYQKAGQLELAMDSLKISYALHQKNDPRFPYETQMDPRFF